MLARYALFCAGCALVQLARLTAVRSTRVLSIVAGLSLVAEALIGFSLFRWWVALVVVAAVTLVIDLAALHVRGSISFILGVVVCLLGALSLAGWF